MKRLLFIFLLLPVLCTAQKDPCRKIDKRVNEAAGTVTYQSPWLLHLSVLKQTAKPAFFALHITLQSESAEFETKGLAVEFEDGTILKDDEHLIDCKEQAAIISNAQANMSMNSSGKYILQAFVYITAENIDLFLTKKIVRVQLGTHAQKIQNKEATLVMTYAKCLSEIK